MTESLAHQGSGFGLLTWNAAWASPKSAAWRWASHAFHDVEVAGLTEIRLDSLALWQGHVASGAPDWGYQNQHPARRKVALWSRSAWADIDTAGHSDLPEGRFVAGTTNWGGQRVRVACVCVPWRSAHVSTGRADRRQWEDHSAYLRALPEVLEAQQEHGLPLAILGDFNQPFPDSGRRIPEQVRNALEETLSPFNVLTTGMSGRKPLIDHVALDPSVQVSRTTVIRALDQGKEMSDHDAVIITSG